MSLNLLIASPNDKFLVESEKFFKEKSYAVYTVNNGKDAQLKMYNEKIFGVILDINIENYPAGQVLKYMRTNFPSTKVVIVMEQEEQLKLAGLSRDTLEKQRVTDIYVGEYQLTDLLNSIEGGIEDKKYFSQKPKNGESKEEEVASADEEFSGVNINDFLSSKAVVIDVYIKLSSGKYLKILHAGDAFSQDRINKYKEEKKVDKLYIKTEDRPKYLRLTNYMTEKVRDKENVSGAVKLKLVKNANEMFVEEVYKNGVKPQVFEQGKRLCDNIYQVVNSSPDLSKVLREFQDFDPNQYAHSHLVCMFSCMLIRQFEWESKVINETIGLASLFHDIGFMELSEGIRDIRPKDMTAEQLEEYKLHPEKGVEILSRQRMVPASVKQIVYQHHECMDGTGFPLQLRSHKTLTLSKIIFLVDEFSHMMIDNKWKPTEALREILTNPECTNRYHSVILESFIKVFVGQNTK